MIHYGTGSILKKHNSGESKRKAVGFADEPTQIVEGNEVEKSEMNGITTDVMRSIDQDEQVVVDMTNQDDKPSDYYTTRSGTERNARDRYSFDHLAMQPKIIMSRQSIRLLQSVIPKERKERTWRHKLYLLMDQPQSSTPALIITVIVSFLVLFSVICLILESFSDFYQYQTLWWVIEGVIAFLFTIEFILRLISSVYNRQDLWQFIKRPMNIIDALSFLPFYFELIFYFIFKATLGEDNYLTNGIMNLQILSVFRVLRLLRIFKMSKHSTKVQLLLLSIKRSVDLLLAVIYFVIAAVFITGTLVYYAERGVFDPVTKEFMRDSPSGIGKEVSPFSSILVGMWYTLITISTTGYGDFVPVTPIGRIIAGFSIFSGLLIVALPSMIIGRTYSEVVHQFEMQKAQIDSQRSKSGAGFVNYEQHENTLSADDTYEDLVDRFVEDTHADDFSDSSFVNPISSVSSTNSSAITKRHTRFSSEDVDEESYQVDQASIYDLLEEQDKILRESITKIEKTRKLIQYSKRKASIVD